MKNPLIVIAASAALLTSPFTIAQDEATKAKIEEALQMEYRSDEERARDRNRRPVQALEFMGLRDDMRVFEFGPGGGWYTGYRTDKGPIGSRCPR